MATIVEGRFVRAESAFRDWVTADGSSGYPAHEGRYHLYVSLACPWAHRTIIVRRLKGLEGVIGLSVVDPIRDERGWAFDEAAGFVDPLNGWSYLSEAYLATDPGYAARVSVPVLWDTETRRIVNNESADIVIMLNEAWNRWAENPAIDLYPSGARAAIDELNAWVYSDLNDGVYQAGFARTQAAYEDAFARVFGALERLDARLAGTRFLFGSRQTLADWRLFATLLRFDPVYHTHFKCNLRRIVDHDHLFAYLRDLYQTPGVAETVDFDQIKRHYYLTHATLNPTRIVPLGPELDLAAPHGRDALGGGSPRPR